MSLTVVCLGLSVFVQIIAAVLAFRLNRLYGRRLAWSLISLAIATMALRRILTLLRIVSHDAAHIPHLEESTGAITLASAILSLIVSILLLAGVSCIRPIFEMLAEAELTIRSERDRLGATLASKEAELAIAAKIQRSFQPKSALRTEHLEINGKCWPAAETAGDYYDYFPLANERILIVVADVAGHGLGPALVMTQMRAWLHALSDSMNDPGAIMTELNRFLVANADDQYFVTMFMASLARDGRELTYASAGHPAYLLNEMDLSVLTEDGLPLGIDSNEVYKTAPKVSLERENLLFVATDGLFEATSSSNEQFGVERVLQQLKHGRNTPSEQLLDSLYRCASEFAQATIADDVTMLLLRTREAVPVEV